MLGTTTDKIHEPRCKVCVHPRRGEIEIALTRQRSYVRIGQSFDLPYRSLANHYRKHLNFEDPIIRSVLEAESAIASENREIGVQKAMARRFLLDLCIQMFLARLLSDDQGAGNLHTN
jgi:hypothetical protein